MNSSPWMLTICYLLQLALFTLFAKALSSYRSPFRRLKPGTVGPLPTESHRQYGWSEELFRPALAAVPPVDCRNRCGGDSPGERGGRERVLRALLFSAGLVLMYLTVPPLLRNLPWWLQGYMAILPFWLLLAWIDSMLRLYALAYLAFFPQAVCTVCVQSSLDGLQHLCWPVNVQPLDSVSLADFWGRRWNRLFGDWLHQHCFQPLRRSPRLALWATFACSGLIHEFLIAVPCYLVHGITLFGWMSGYFLLQPLGILVEQRWFRRHPRLRRVFCWLVVLLPVPLVLNPATLTVFCISDCFGLEISVSSCCIPLSDFLRFSAFSVVL